MMKFTLQLTFVSVLLLCALFLSVQVTSAEDAPSPTEYRVSDIGIDYRAIAEPPLDVMLSHGEAEFIENATPLFEAETAEAWREMSAEIATGLVAEITVDAMREFTPSMLRSFSALELSHPQYGRLSSLASLFISESFLSNTEN